MSISTEQRVRDLFAADAAAAPVAVGLAAGARRRVRRRRQVQMAFAAGVVAAAVTATVVLADGRPVERTRRPPVAAASGQPPIAAASGPAVDRPLPGGAADSCSEEYSAAMLARRAFAFDGTVTAIGPARTNRPDGGTLDLVAATFQVNQWFRGGTGTVVVVDMTPPQPTADQPESGPSYAVGSRLLVSGEPRWGGAPLADALAWGCGFTRFYTPQTAAGWAAATK